MKAIIYAAGLGTRFKPWTDVHPKALALINGKTLLQRNIEYLQQYGFNEVVVNVHHFADQIIAAIEEHHGWGSSIQISDERDEVLETGGGLLKAASMLKEEELFLSINADILTDLDIHALLDTFKQTNALASLAVSGRKSSRKLLLNDENQLCGWKNLSTGEEKIVRHSPETLALAYSGVCVYSPKIFELMTQKGKFSIMDAFLSLAADHKVIGVTHEAAKWIDVGRPESVAIAEEMFL